ncbi:MAG: 2'-5' RNA ligase family protein [Patescibacteria group bacterium]|nr:2'-5' RNA ligase family protein [Patescibacteria group bacterium]MDD4610999.1 2'-5' RNA ligase family protein [Patescibacteria group bacterium]
MKYFNVIVEFKLTKKPDWFDGFRKKYDKPFKFHISLKNGTKVKEKDINNLKEDIKIIAKNFRSIKLGFSKLWTSNKSSRGWCIMVKADKNPELLKLQKVISKNLAKYGDYVLPEYKDYEKKFKPHVTIGRHLTDEKIKEAKKEIGKNLYCEAEINSLTLMIVNNFTLKSLLDRKNCKIYKLWK